MLDLYPHNQKAYESIKNDWKSQKKTCIIHATGTGKSLIIAKNILENPAAKHLFLAPSVFIFDELKKQLKNNVKNVKFLTYQYLLVTDISILKNYDFIYLDEFHRIGAEEWGKAVNTLLSFNVSANVLGTSATHIRTLDKNKNMAEELFNGSISSKLSLKDSIKNKIHKKPKYITALYKIEHFIQSSEEKILKLDVSEKIKKIQLDKIYNLKINWERTKGIDFILNKHLTKDRKKIIVFCNNTAHLKESRNLLNSFFLNYYGNNVNLLEVNSKISNVKNRKTLNVFNQSELAVLFCVDMLNEGIHIDSVDTCILLRETQSDIVYFQQIGRTFKVGQKFNPLIFDMVNNFKIANKKENVINYFENDLKDNFENISNIDSIRKKKNESDLLVEFHDEIKDFDDIFENISKIEWEEKLGMIKNYFEKHGFLPNNRTPLGIYIQNLKHMYRINTLEKTKIRALLDITPIFFEYKKNIAWEKQFVLFREYFNKYQIIPGANENSVGKWIHKQKQKYKNNVLLDEYKDRLLEIDPTLFSNFRTSVIKRINDENLKEVKSYFNKHGKFPAQKTKLGRWLSNIKNRGNNVEVGKELLKLDKNFFDNKLDKKWEKNFENLKIYWKKNQKLPPQSTNLGLWFAGVKQRKKALGTEKIKMFLEISPDIFKSKKEIDFEKWMEAYNEVKDYFEKNKKLPKISNNNYIGSWINQQKTYFNNSSLNNERKRLLLEISPDFFKSKKEIDFEKWMETYNEVKDYFEKNKKLPLQKTKLGGWLSRSKSYLNNIKNPSEEQQQKLKLLSFFSIKF